MSKRTAVLSNKHIFNVTITMPGTERTKKYFSVTAEETTPKGRFVAAGCLHNDILKLFPDLKDVVALHLSDRNGIPMHAFSNGWYWLEGACGGLGSQFHGGNNSDYDQQSPDQCRTILAEHLRISDEEATILVATTKRLADSDGITAAKNNFQVFVDDQIPRWQREANAAVKKYGRNNE